MTPSTFLLWLLAFHFIVRQSLMSAVAAYSRRSGPTTYLAGRDTVAILWCGYALLLVFLVFSLNRRVLTKIDLLAYLILLCGTSLRSWGLWALRGYYSPTTVVFRRHKVIRRGPFQWLRHPLYFGLTIELCGLCILARDGALTVIVAVSVLEVLRQMQREQELLARHLGVSYQQFCQATWDVTDISGIKKLTVEWNELRAASIAFVGLLLRRAAPRRERQPLNKTASSPATAE